MLRKILATAVATATLALTAAPAQAATAYASDATYDTTSGGTAAQKASVDLTKVTYWNTDTRFYVKWKVRNLRDVRGKMQFVWEANMADGSMNKINIAWVETSGIHVNQHFDGKYGATVCSGRGGRALSYANDYVRVWVPRSCIPKGKAATYPYGKAALLNSSWGTIVSDRSKTGGRITPNP